MSSLIETIPQLSCWCLSSEMCPTHPGMTHLSFFLLAAIKPSFTQRAREALALSWVQMNDLPRNTASLFFSLRQLRITWHQCNH